MDRLGFKVAVVLGAVATLVASAMLWMLAAGPTAPSEATFEGIVPRPAEVEADRGTFTLTPDTTVAVNDASPEVLEIGQYLSEALAPATGWRLAVVQQRMASGPHVTLQTLDVPDEGLGSEGYTLAVTRDGVVVKANEPAGLFYGVQTLLQALPPSIKQSTVQPGPWVLPCGTVRDIPRFEWRGLMLEPGRPFVDVEAILGYIDIIAQYKMNRLHLHLSDDQGWWMAIDTWPQLTAPRPDGEEHHYLTKDDYERIVEYAASRYIIVVPEITMPGHMGAAIAAYPELSCPGQGNDLNTGQCPGDEESRWFVEDVIAEIAAITPGPYFHLGGDEAFWTPPDAFAEFWTFAAEQVRDHDMLVVGWEEAVAAELPEGAILQHWNVTEGFAPQAAAAGIPLIMSPANRAYLDMKHDVGDSLGIDWAGETSTKDAYDWDPATEVAGVGEDDLVGVEAVMWTALVRTENELESLMFPRIIAMAEVGWSLQSRRTWSDFQGRLAAQEVRLQAQDVDFHRSPEVPWGG